MIRIHCPFSQGSGRQWAASSRRVRLFPVLIPHRSPIFSHAPPLFGIMPPVPSTLTSVAIRFPAEKQPADRPETMDHLDRAADPAAFMMPVRLTPGPIQLQMLEHGQLALGVNSRPKCCSFRTRPCSCWAMLSATSGTALTAPKKRSAGVFGILPAASLGVPRVGHTEHGVIGSFAKIRVMENTVR